MPPRITYNLFVKYRVVHLSGRLAGRTQDIEATATLLGHDPASQVLFSPEDAGVEGRHAELLERDGVLRLRKLEGGTFLGGEGVEEAEVSHGDILQLGTGGPTIRVEFEALRPLGAKIVLTVLSGSLQGTTLELAGSVFRIGRDPGNTLATPDDPMVSGQHAKIVRLSDRYVLIDLDSSTGTFLNGRRVERERLADGDVIGLGKDGPEIRVDLTEALERAGSATVVIPHFADLVEPRSGAFIAQEIPFGWETLTVGRSEASDILLDSPIVSRSHARLTRRDGALIADDLGSTNGTYLNGRRIERGKLEVGDRLVVGPFELEIAAALVRVLDTRSRTRLDAMSLSVVAGGDVILDDVSLSLPPGSFTAIIGPSGAGKSTLLSALNGARPADKGRVLLNGVDLYRSAHSLKGALGYVPQDDIVHPELTVWESLDYAAQLRLPRSMTPAERSKRVRDVLATLELSDWKDAPIRRLSGGQRKRVSIASELLTEPNLLFLDEPTSGLDPGLEESLMLLLRELSYKGKTVVLVTHTLEHLHLCDAVALLVEGHLAFFGTADEARAHFAIDHMVNLYARLKEKPPGQWRGAPRGGIAEVGPVERALHVAPEAPAGPLQQFRILFARYLKTVIRDARNALLLVAQAPLVAGLIGLSLLYGQSDVAYTKPKNTLLFLLALTAVWFGCSNAAREIVKEKTIYLRERMTNLSLLPYILSKVAVLSGLAALQCVLFLVILDLWLGIPGEPLLIVASMLLASAVGILLGLCLSALVESPDRAMTLLPIVLIPQVLFTIPSVQLDMKGPAGLIARAMPTWWAYDLLRRVALAPELALDDDAIEGRLQAGRPVLMTKNRFEAMLQEGYPMFNYRGGIEVTWTASFPDKLGEHLPQALGRWRPALADTAALTLFGSAFLAATALLQKRKDRGP
jgi:ABC-type multidrug transport system ATPase subunit